MANLSPQYEWFLHESPSLSSPFAPLKKVGPLQEAKNRTYSLLKNRAGSAQFSLTTGDDMIKEILDSVDFGDIRGTIRHSIRIRRNKQDLWSGPITGIQGSLAQDQITFSCVGWMEELQNRIIWANARDYTNGGVPQPVENIVFGLLSDANNISDPSNPGGVTPDLAHPILIQPGHVDAGLQPRVEYYQQGQNIGQAIQAMSDIEDGYDYEVDPITRELNLYDSQNWVVRENVVFGYNWGPNNLVDVQWQEDASKLTNYVGIGTSLGSGMTICYDTASEDIYNRVDSSQVLTGAATQVLAPYGMAELVVYRRPFVTWTLVPFPRTADDSGPSLFDDFDLGDQISFNARKGHVKIKDQSVRVFGATVNLDDNGNETISALQTAPAT